MRSSPAVQDRPATLIGNFSDYAIGGFGGVGVMYTRFADTNAVQVCGEGAVILDHTLTFGGGGCGVATEVKAERFGNGLYGPDDRLNFGYGGAIIKYHFFSRQMVNLAIGALVGAGGLAITTWKSGQSTEQEYNAKRGEAVFVFEPQIGVFLNVTRWMRLGASGGYRVVSGINTPGLRWNDIAGPSVGGHVQLGWF